jgi:trk system potassium uptake protein TrkA
MYIIVIGGGKVGYYLAQALLDQGHEILVVEKDPARTQLIIDVMGSVCIRGDGCEVTTLAEAGTGRAEMFIAVTGDDEDNLVACQVAKHKFNVPRTVARINNPKNEAIFTELGIDVAVSSTNIILESITEEVPTHSLTHLMDIREKGIEVVELKIPADAKTVGKEIRELTLPPENRLFLIIPKQGKPHVPTASTVLQAEDQIIAITTPDSEKALRKALRGS